MIKTFEDAKIAVAKKYKPEGFLTLNDPQRFLREASQLYALAILKEPISETVLNADLVDIRDIITTIRAARLGVINQN